MVEIEMAFEEAVRGRVPVDVAAVSISLGERQWEHLKTGEVVTAPAPIGDAGSATDRVVLSRQPLIRNDILNDTRFRVSDNTRESGIRSDIILPLVYGKG